MTEVAEAATAGPTYEFNSAFQTKIAALTLRDTLFVQRTDGLVKPEYFENEVEAAIVAIALDFAKKYKKAPDRGSIMTLMRDAIAAKRIRKDLGPELRGALKTILASSLGDRDFVVDHVATFARQRAVENAMITSVGALEKRDFAKIEKLMRAALDTGASDDVPEYDYFKEIKARTEHRIALATGTIKPDGITTGLPDLDKHLMHKGWGRQELSAIMGRAKFGKSMALGDFAKGAALAGHPTIIFTLENSPRIYSDRMDANLSDVMIKLLGDKPLEVCKKIEAIEARSAVIKIRGYPSGSLKPSQIRRVLERYRQNGLIFDLIVVDYADIMAPEHFTGETREDSRAIWIDLRAIAGEQNAALLTATQTNRDGAKAMTSKATDIAEDYNKARIADLIISGNATESEIAAGEARLFFAASRNQEGEFSVRIQQDRAKMKFLTKVLGVER